MARPATKLKLQPGSTRAAAQEPVDALFNGMAARGLSYMDVLTEAGISSNTLTSWKRGATSPTVLHLTRALELVGKKLVVVDA